jgi:dTDP-4-dehydrorhamnose reductase
LHKILVTGASGLLGSSLVEHLRRCDYSVVTHAHKTQADFMFDLSDLKKTNQMLGQIQPSLIINLVGLTNVDTCEEWVNLAYLANVRSVESLVRWISSTDNSCHLIHISTDHVYDGEGLNTEDEVVIVNNYSFSKYAGELAASCVPSTILRTNFVGRSHVNHRQSFTDWIYKSIILGKPIELLNDVFFSPLSIDFLVRMIELVSKKLPIGIYNLGSHNGMSKASFAFALAECLELPTVNMSRIDTSQAKFIKTYRPKNMCMDITKFENTLNIKLPELSELIQQISKEYRE